MSAGATARRAPLVLAGVVALQLVAETALTPYWPLLFRRLFGVEELAVTGSYLAACRVAGLAALPLWGLATLRWPVRTLLVVGLGLSAVLDLALALAPTWWLFTAFSAGVVASGSVLVLAYPALVAVTDRVGRDRRGGVVAYWAVCHASLVLATVVGAGIVLLEQPRWGLAAFAVVDVVLAVAVWSLVPAQPPRGRLGTSAEATALPRSTGIRPWLVLGAAVVAVDAGLAVARPYFVELLVRGGTGAVAAGWLFLLPGLAALAVLPATGSLLDRLGSRSAPVAAAVASAGLALQALSALEGHLVALALGRVLLGFGTGVLLVALDLAVFARTGTHGAAFSAVETGRSAALLAAPLLATLAAGAWLGGPLLVAAALLLAAGALATPARRDPLPPPDHSHLPHPERTDDLDLVH